MLQEMTETRLFVVANSATGSHRGHFLVRRGRSARHFDPGPLRGCLLKLLRSFLLFLAIQKLIISFDGRAPRTLTEKF